MSTPSSAELACRIAQLERDVHALEQAIRELTERKQAA